MWACMPAGAPFDGGAAGAQVMHAIYPASTHPPKTRAQMMFSGFFSPATPLIKAIWAPGFLMCAVASYVLKASRQWGLRLVGAAELFARKAAASACSAWVERQALNNVSCSLPCAAVAPQDAADRDRLAASTFKTLNLGASWRAWARARVCARGASMTRTPVLSTPFRPLTIHTCTPPPRLQAWRALRLRTRLCLDLRCTATWQRSTTSPCQTW